MIQLDKFTYGKGGQFICNEDSKSTTLGPMKCMDSAAELARLETDDPDLTPIFCELGPFEDQTSFFFLFSIDELHRQTITFGESMKYYASSLTGYQNPMTTSLPFPILISISRTLSSLRMDLCVV
jgi:hypothetical protein